MRLFVAATATCRVFYDKLGVKFETYNQWLASGARIPSTVSGSH